jgi:hypothetical protein
LLIKREAFERKQVKAEPVGEMQRVTDLLETATKELRNAQAQYRKAETVLLASEENHSKALQMFNATFAGIRSANLVKPLDG